MPIGPDTDSRMKKTYVITGASGLIGTELCREFLQSGHTVYGFDIVKKIDKDFGHLDYHFVKCDLSKESQIRKSLSKIHSINVLINNAARTAMPRTPFDKLSLRQWNDGIAIDLTSHFLMAKYALAKLKKSNGVILNISSSRHLMSEAHTEIYSTSKGGVSSMTHAMAISLAGRVRVNSISPGWIAAPNAKLSKKDHEQHPVKRVGRPSDISKIAAYLCSEDASFITGQDFVVDGGMTKKMIYEE